MFLKIDKDLLILKCLYFLELSIVACLLIYINLFMNERGVTKFEIAIINFLGNIFSFIIRPICGFLADKYQHYKQILIVSGLLCLLVNWGQLFIPKYSILENADLISNYILIDKSNLSDTYLLCNRNVSLVQCGASKLNKCLLNTSSMLTTTNNSCYNIPIFRVKNSVDSNLFSESCSKSYKDCDNSLFYPQNNFSLSLNISLRQSAMVSSGMTWSITFWLFLICRVISFCVYSVLLSLTDAITFVTLGRERSHKFGFTRMFGTIGILCFSFITGVTLTHFPRITEFTPFNTHYFPCFVLSGVVFVLSIIISFFITNDKAIQSEPFWKSFNVLFRNVETSVFFMFAFFGGCIFSVLAEYYFLALNELFPNLPNYFFSMIFAIMTISEAVCLGVSPLIFKVLNEEFWISVAFVVWAIRWISYFFVTNYWLLIIIELFGGSSFGLMLPCMMFYISKFADKTTQGRVQSLFSGIFFNIGGAFGSLFGGIILSKFGYRNLFITSALFSLICAILYFAIQKLIVRRYYTTPEDSELKHDGKTVALLQTENGDITT